MRSASREVDIVCLCNTHGIGGAQLNAGMLAQQFELRGFRAALGFLFEREVTSAHGHEDVFIITDRAPGSAAEVLRFAGKCYREISRRKPRAIIGFQPASNAISALVASAIPGCAAIASQRNPASFQSRLGRISDKAMGSVGLYRSNIAVSHAVASSYNGYPEPYLKRLHVVHNATPPLPDPAEDRIQSRKRLGIPPEQRAIGCIGRLHPQKSFLTAILAHAQLPADIHLYLAGEGPELDFLRHAAESSGTAARVHFVGSLTGFDIARFYRAIDILLFTSIYEGFGRVLIEALSEGVPVVSNDIPIAREVAGNAAVFCSGQDDWAPVALNLLENEAERTILSAKGRARASRFTIDSMVDAYLELSGLTATV